MRDPRNVHAAWLDLARGSIAPGKIVRLPVLSGSMLPDLPPGSTIRIRGGGWQGCRRGDIIVFRQDGGLTAHRLLLALSLGRHCLLFQKGDRNRYGRWIRGSRVVGRVVGLEPVDGASLDLEAGPARRRAVGEASRQLRRDFRNRLLRLPRAVLGLVRSLAGRADSR